MRFGLNARFGFQLGFHSHLCKLKSATSNCPSAIEHPAVIDEYLPPLHEPGLNFNPGQHATGGYFFILFT
jgi:hypothetical protein